MGVPARVFARSLVFLRFPLSLCISVEKKNSVSTDPSAFLALLAELAQAFATLLNSVLQRS